MKPFELKIVFIDGKYIIIENVTSYGYASDSNSWRIDKKDSDVYIFVNADKVRLIGLASDLEDVLF
ncbi:MAG: hypothetical protein PHX08_08205 [Lachnospiraceae bacterium]|nr:hypothetical protein [Lachnospiraceae bacterium]